MHPDDAAELRRLMERVADTRRTGQVWECLVVILREFWRKLNVEDQRTVYDIVHREAEKRGWR